MAFLSSAPLPSSSCPTRQLPFLSPRSAPSMIRAPPQRPVTAAPVTTTTPPITTTTTAPPTTYPSTPDPSTYTPPESKQPRRRIKVNDRAPPATVDVAARRDRTREFYYDDLPSVHVRARTASPPKPARAAKSAVASPLAPPRIELGEETRGRDLADEEDMAPGDDAKKKKKKAGRRSTASGDDSIRSYLHEIGEVKLLNAESEINLAREIASLLELERVSARLKEVSGVDPTIPDWAAAAGMDIESFRDTLRRGLRAKEHMVAANLRLVVSIAKKYLNRGLTFQDLIQEGSIGLIRGAEKFDGNKGFKFSTYATWWIRQAITRAIADHSRPIRLPVHVNDTIAAIKKTTKMLHTELHRPPTETEIADKMQLSIEKLRFMARSGRSTISLETPIGKDGRDSNATLGSFIVWDGDTPEDATMKSLLREDLENVLNTLSSRERDVIRMRYGFDDGKMKTLEEIGYIFDVTRERIRQIEAKALRKLRHPNRNAVLREYVYEEQ